MIKIQFTKAAPVGARRYNAGQVAVFSRWVAAALVSRGVAEYVATDARPAVRGVAVTESRAKVHAGRPADVGPVALATSREINKSAKDSLLVYVARLGGTIEDTATVTTIRRVAAQLTAEERERRDRADALLAATAEAAELDKAEAGQDD